MFYYYENETGYSYINSGGLLYQQESNMFFFDDGKRDISGFSAQVAGSTSQQTIQTISMAALSGNSSLTSSNQAFDFTLVDISHLNGSYLGISEQYYYYLAYYFYQQRTGIQARYTDIYGIPYGKVNLTVSQPVINQNFIGALSNNLVLTIGGDVIAYQIVAVSATTYRITTTALPRSYYG